MATRSSRIIPSCRTMHGSRRGGRAVRRPQPADVYHPMFDPRTARPASSWTTDAACLGCSFRADHVDGMLPHLAARDVTLVAISRGAYAALAAYRQRMGW